LDLADDNIEDNGGKVNLAPETLVEVLQVDTPVLLLLMVVLANDVL